MPCESVVTTKTCRGRELSLAHVIISKIIAGGVLVVLVLGEI